MAQGKLSDVAIRKAKPANKPVKLVDGRGLYLLVQPNGGKLWRFNYRFGGKYKTLALGVYPDVSLAKARTAHQEARTLLADGIDPAASRREQAHAAAAKTLHTVQAVAQEWLDGPHAAKVTPGTRAATEKLLSANIFPSLGATPIADVTAPDLLAALRPIEARATYSAHKLLQTCGRLWRYAIATGKVERDIAADLQGALKPFKVKHHAAITDPVRLGDLLRAIDGYHGSPLTVAALKLGLLTFVRPGELRKARWANIDLDGKTWAYHVGKTKTEHIVPLSRQAIAVLTDLRDISGAGELVFPGVRAKGRPMSENTVNGALRGIGFDADEVTGHGFRATARTILDEVLEIPAHLIEHQLAHSVRDPLGRAYNRTAHLPQRREMMQQWADYLGQVRAGAKIIAFRQA